MTGEIAVGQVWEIWWEGLNEGEEERYWLLIEDCGYDGSDEPFWTYGKASHGGVESVLWGDPDNAYWEGKRRRIL